MVQRRSGCAVISGLAHILYDHPGKSKRFHSTLPRNVQCCKVEYADRWTRVRCEHNSDTIALSLAVMNVIAASKLIAGQSRERCPSQRVHQLKDRHHFSGSLVLTPFEEQLGAVKPCPPDSQQEPLHRHPMSRNVDASTPETLLNTAEHNRVSLDEVLHLDLRLLALVDLGASFASLACSPHAVTPSVSHRTLLHGPLSHTRFGNGTSPRLTSYTRRRQRRSPTTASPVYPGTMESDTTQAALASQTGLSSGKAAKW